MPRTKRDIVRFCHVLSLIKPDRTGHYTCPVLSGYGALPIRMARIACSTRIALGQPDEGSSGRVNVDPDKIEDLCALNGAIEPPSAGVLLLLSSVLVCDAGFVELGSDCLDIDDVRWSACHH